MSTATRRVEGLRREIERVENAPTPRSERLDELRQRVDMLAKRGEPRLNGHPGTVVDWPAESDLLARLAWFDSDHLLARLAEQLPEESGEAIGTGERQGREDW